MVVGKIPECAMEVLKFMVGQHDKWENVDHCGLPFNRHRRRQLETCRGVVLHLYAGGEHQAKKWQCLQGAGFEVLTLDVTLGANHNLHGRQLYAYVMHLARSGQIKFVIGGPPRRTISRLRHKRPGPKPLRGRGEKRWRLEDLTDEEVEKVHGDTALVLRMMAIYDVVAEASPELHAY